ncbi:MAG: amidophosphoribosyltransferase [Candidatus Aegiribacteria sp.]
MNRAGEYCGLCGISGFPGDQVSLVAEGLLALQHRGQEAAGLLTCTDGSMRLHKRKGTVGEAMSDIPPDFFGGDISSVIGHVRYGTYGGEDVENAQPLLVRMAGFQIGIAHNGTLTNAGSLRDELQRQGAIFLTRTDTEVVLHLMSRNLEQTGFNIRDALEIALRRLQGAYCFLIMSPEGMYAVRDPLGFRPLSLGRFEEGGWIVASETLAFDVCGAEYLREIQAGEVLFIPHEGFQPESEIIRDRGNLFRKRRGLAQCIFEHVYFARPGSRIFGDSVYTTRLAMGRQLAREHPVDCDIVAPVPDSGMFAAMGFARELNAPFDMCFTRNHYIGRTFIDPASARRAAMVMRKLQPIPEAVKGRKLCVVEDSIVRGTTSRARIRALREAGAEEVHMRVSCPPHKYGCYFGIDFPEPSSLIARNFSVEEIAAQLGVDSLGYLSKEGMLSCVAAHSPGDYCTACFDGEYPVDLPDLSRGDGGSPNGC